LKFKPLSIAAMADIMLAIAIFGLVLFLAVSVYVTFLYH
jgi:hypothetical protein